jgi:hypothetical protein
VGLYLLTLGVLAAMLLTAGCGSDDQGPSNDVRRPEDFLPKNLSDWELSDYGTASNAGELQTLINGGYNTYMNHNMRECASGNYVAVGQGEEMHIWVFEMPTVEDAVALSEDDNLLATRPDLNVPEDLGDSAVLDTFNTHDKKLYFRRGKYFVRVTVLVGATGEEQYARSQAIMIGRNIDEDIQS